MSIPIKIVALKSTLTLKTNCSLGGPNSRNKKDSVCPLSVVSSSPSSSIWVKSHPTKYQSIKLWTRIAVSCHVINWIGWPTGSAPTSPPPSSRPWNVAPASTSAPPISKTRKRPRIDHFFCPTPQNTMAWSPRSPQMSISFKSDYIYRSSIIRYAWLFFRTFLFI